MKNQLIAINIILLSLTPVHAEIKTGAATLLLGGGARATALRGAYTAAAGDVDAMVYNPGGLSAIGRPQASVTHAEMALGATYDVIQYAHPKNHGAWGVSLARLGLGDIEGRSTDRQSTGTENASDLLASFSYSHDFQAIAGLGATVKFFENRIASDRASTVAFDLGTVVRVPNRSLWFGASALNMGHGLQFAGQTTPLPLTLALGVAGRVANAMNLTMDVKRYVRNETTHVVTGMEYFLLPNTAMRIGYDSLLSGSQPLALSELGNWKGGLGLAIHGYQLDYAISSDSEFDSAHRVTFSKVF